MPVKRDDIIKREYRDRVLIEFSVKVDAGDFDVEAVFTRGAEDDRLWRVRSTVPLPWGLTAVEVQYMTYSSSMKVEDIAAMGMQLLVQNFVQAANDFNAMSYAMTKLMQ